MGFRFRCWISVSAVKVTYSSLCFMRDQSSGFLSKSIALRVVECRASSWVMKMKDFMPSLESHTTSCKLERSMEVSTECVTSAFRDFSRLLTEELVKTRIRCSRQIFPAKPLPYYLEYIMFSVRRTCATYVPIRCVPVRRTFIVCTPPR
jgi:hypothetical protein